ncbi:hypothetical protein ES703_61921 [subsurface metagenome]
MENKPKIENLVRLIRNFNNKCSECRKIFLGALIEG